MQRADRTLVALLKEGDCTAFDEIYGRFRPRIFTFLLRLCGRRALAEDLSQDVWIRLSTKANTLDPDTNLRAWLFTVARNAYLSHRRWLLVDLDRMRTLRLFPSSSAPSAHAQVSTGERAAWLEQALLTLPPKYREALLLVSFEEMTPSEAAEVLGLRPEALRKRLSRARAMLRKKLEAHETIRAIVQEETP